MLVGEGLSKGSQKWTARHKQGALWKVMASLCFAGTNALIKGVGQTGVPSAQLAFLGHAFAVLWLAPLAWRARPWAHAWKRLDLYGARLVFSVAGVLLWYAALQYVPMAQAVALGFLGPIVTMAGSVLVLKERLTRGRAIALGLSLLGGLMISGVHGFSSVSFQWFVLLPLGSAVMFSCSTLLNKRLTDFQDPLRVVMALMVPMTVLLGLYAWPVWRPLALEQWLAACGLGAFTALAHVAVTRSFACTDLLFVLPIGALRFVATAVLGVLCFGQWLDLPVYLGFLLILGALFVLGSFERAPQPLS